MDRKAFYGREDDDRFYCRLLSFLPVGDKISVCAFLMDGFYDAWLGDIWIHACNRFAVRCSQEMGTGRNRYVCISIIFEKNIRRSF